MPLRRYSVQHLQQRPRAHTQLDMQEVRDPNCSECGANAAQRTICSAGYGRKADGKCEKCTDPNCTSCGDNAATCRQCSEGYRIKNEDGTCEKCTVAGCKICHSNVNTCTECLDKTMPNEDGLQCVVDPICTPYASGCTSQYQKFCSKYSDPS